MGATLGATGKSPNVVAPGRILYIELRALYTMPAMLTNASIRNAKPGVKAVRLFDGGGLYLEVAPSGGKWWRLKYRIGGKEKRISLGVFPNVSLKNGQK